MALHPFVLSVAARQRREVEGRQHYETAAAKAFLPA